MGEKGSGILVVDKLEVDLLGVAGIDKIDVLTAGDAPEALDTLLTEKPGDIRRDGEFRFLTGCSHEGARNDVRIVVEFST